MYWNLKEGSTTTRERFLSTYKRDKLSKQLNASLQGMLQVMAVTQNMTQHCTIVEDQTTLYTKNCMDSTQLYIVSTIHDKATIQVLDQNATDTSSKYKEVTEAYKQTFQDFLRALEENENIPIPFDEP
ncbi:hypothetical protein V8E54_004732 [Elaphomyces granulatus]